MTLAACLIGASVGAGAFPLFLAPVLGLELEARFGWSRLDTSSLTSVGLIGAAVGSPIIGWLNDRWSVRGTVTLSMLAIGVVLVLAAWAPPAINVWRCGFFVLMVLGAGTLTAPFSKIVCARFHAMRGLALGLTIGSVSLLAAVALPWLSATVDRVGIARFFIGAGVFYLLAAAPILWILLSRFSSAGSLESAPPASGSDDGAPAPGSTIWLLGFAAVVSAASAGAAPHLAAVAAEGRNVPPALVGSVFAATVMLSRPMSGLIVDRIDARRVAAAVTAMAAIGLVLVALRGDRHVVLGAILVACAVGAELDIVAFLTSRYVPAARFGRTYGWIYSAVLVAAAIGPVLIARHHDLTGDYRITFLTAAALAALAAGLMLRLPPYARNGNER